MKKTKVGPRLLATVLALVIVLGLLPMPSLAEGSMTLYIDFEGYNLGQGFYIEPTAVTVPIGSTAETATRAILEQTGHDYIFGGTGETFYLSSVKNFDKGWVNVPGYMTEDITDYLPGTSFKSDNEDGYLGELDFTLSSGWMLTVNHEMLQVGAGVRTLRDGDVIRWQFSLLN